MIYLPTWPIGKSLGFNSIWVNLLCAKLHLLQFEWDYVRCRSRLSHDRLQSIKLRPVDTQ